MQQCFLSKLDIIPDKLDAVVAAMSYCDISKRPTPSGLLVASEADWIPLLFWLGVTDITSVTRFTSFLASVALGLTSLLELINRHKLFHTTGPILSLIE